MAHLPWLLLAQPALASSAGSPDCQCDTVGLFCGDGRHAGKPELFRDVFDCSSREHRTPRKYASAPSRCARQIQNATGADPPRSPHCGCLGRRCKKQPEPARNQTCVDAVYQFCWNGGASCPDDDDSQFMCMHFCFLYNVQGQCSPETPREWTACERKCNEPMSTKGADYPTYADCMFQCEHPSGEIVRTALNKQTGTDRREDDAGTLWAPHSLGVADSGAQPSKVCFCPNWRYSNFNCSTACCSLARPIECKPPPAPNPPTNMTTVTVEGAVAMGALTPRGEAPTIELNTTGSKGWVIHMSGGGWGFRKNTTATTAAGGAGAWVRDGADGVSLLGAGQLGAQPKYSGCYMFCDGVLSADAAQNPLFHDFNKVFIPINDGTSFTGNLERPIPASVPPKYPNKWPIYLRGGRIVSAVVSFLMKAHGMSAATDVIITGGSSGGMAVYLNCDRIADQIHAVNSKIRVTCLADAGMFLDHPGLSGTPTLSPEFIQSFYAWNSSSMTDEDCIAHYTPLGTPWKCIFSQYVLPFVKTPLFIAQVTRVTPLVAPRKTSPRSERLCPSHCCFDELCVTLTYMLGCSLCPVCAQNLYDSYQLGHILHIGECSTYGKDLSACPNSTVDAVQAYGATMRGIIKSGLAAPGLNRGAFAPSCIAHCQTVANEHPAALWNWPSRSGIDQGSNVATPELAFNAWYTKGAGAAGAKVIEACDFGCNSKCPLFT
jgi:hypothetical protein